MRTVLGASFAALVCLSGNVYAACTQASLQGRWHYFSSNTVFREDSTVDFTFVEECPIRITREGVVVDNRCALETGVTWGDTDFFIGRNCTVRARSEFCDLVGQISPDKEVVSGTGFCCCFEDEPDSGNFVLEFDHTFNLVKKSSTGEFFPASSRATVLGGSACSVKGATASTCPGAAIGRLV